MTAISGTLTTAATSAAFTPTAMVSDVVVRKNGSGRLFLEATAGTITDIPVTEICGSGCIPVSTSDTAVTYKFRAEGQDIDFDYYMGP